MDAHNALLVGAIVIVIIGIVMGIGENRSVIIFRDYNDLGLTFLIPASFALIVILFEKFGGNPQIAKYLGASVSLLLLLLLVKNTYIDNGKNIIKFAIALVTKLPLGIVWVLNLIEVLSPSGKGDNKAKNRGQALIVLAILTPIIGALVVNKTGSFFNPSSWIRGRRVGSAVRSSL
jgi:hypothetical protein